MTQLTAAEETNIQHARHLLEKESILESKIFRVYGMAKAAFFGSTVNDKTN